MAYYRYNGGYLRVNGAFAIAEACCCVDEQCPNVTPLHATVRIYDFISDPLPCVDFSCAEANAIFDCLGVTELTYAFDMALAGTTWSGALTGMHAECTGGEWVCGYSPQNDGVSMALYCPNQEAICGTAVGWCLEIFWNFYAVIGGGITIPVPVARPINLSGTATLRWVDSTCSVKADYHIWE